MAWAGGLCILNACRWMTGSLCSIPTAVKKRKGFLRMSKPKFRIVLDYAVDRYRAEEYRSFLWFGTWERILGNYATKEDAAIVLQMEIDSRRPATVVNTYDKYGY